MTGLREDEREPSFAEQICRRIHLTRWQFNVSQFGACDECRRYVLAVLESNWLAERDRRLAARAAQTDAATALDEVLERLSERREEEWGNYIGGPGGHVEALLQGRFDGLVVACAIVRELRAALTSEPQP